MAKVKGKPKWVKKMVLQEIKAFFDRARTAFKTDRRFANEHVRKARRLSMKFKVKLPRELKRRFCKHCYSYLMPSVNLRVRTKNGKVVYYCLECKRFTRFRYA